MSVDEVLKRLGFLLEQNQGPEGQIEYIARDLDENGIDYCIIGGMSLGIHNFKRYTSDIDILLSKTGFKKLKETFIGRGYSYRPGSEKNLYYHVHTGTKIPIDILVEGDNNGIIMPHPKSVRQKLSGIWWITLPNLINFKLTAGRSQDINDVIRLIMANELTEEYSEQLRVDVRESFLKLLGEI